MALVVESTSSNVVSDSNSVTVTKPTGTVEGDLLILAMSVGPAETSSASGFTLIEEFFQNNAGAVQDSEVAFYYKIAGASEPSSYTVSGGVNQTGAATIYRISGWGSGAPAYNKATGGGYHDAASGTLTVSETINRPSNSLTIVATTHYGNNSVTLSNYSITTGGANPTWTEAYEIAGFTVASGAKTGSFATAYAYDTNKTDITSFSQTFASSTSGDPEGWATIILTILEPVNVVSKVSHINASPSVDGITVSQVNATAGTGLTEITPTIKGVDTKSTTSTEWTEETKGSDTWTNESL